MQTARIDYNINEKNAAWFRFQNDSGLQAAYTDAINPLFNAISPQPLYSFAAGYTHVFSQNLVNYFNPAFSWYESLFGPEDFEKTLAAFPIVLEGSGANAPYTTLGRSEQYLGPRAPRHAVFPQRQSGLDSRIARTSFRHQHPYLSAKRFRFRTGRCSACGYATLPQFIYGVASTASRTFTVANSQPYNFLNADFYAQDTWKITPALTWTFGLRSTYNSNPLNPHNAVARLKGSFDAVSHDVNQPLNSAIQTNLQTRV